MLVAFDTVTLEYDPSKQNLQVLSSVAPEADENFPTAHDRHAAAFFAMPVNFPGGHMRQEFAPEA